MKCLELKSEAVRVCEMPLTERTAAARERQQSVEEWYESKASWLCPVTSSLVASIRGQIEMDTRLIANLRAARTALAVERYRLDTGRLPEKPGELRPRYMEEIPEDPFDGKPLRYKRLDNGYVIYSIGPDGKDDGGVEEGPDGQEPPDVTFTVAR